MITITEKERNDMLSSSEETLMVKTQKALCAFKKGESTEDYAVSLSSAICSMVALREYNVAGFTPESYFNIINADDAFGIYSRSNSLT